MAVAARAFVLSRIADLSLQPLRHTPSSPLPRHIILRPLLHPFGKKPQFSGGIGGCSGVVSCLISGVDGGGVSDDFVSTRKAGFEREFSVIAAMLKRIEPLDTSLISKGVSESAKDSMKQTISTMLGLLPSDHFSVTVRVSKDPLGSLLMSSIITGYTLWNAEYRVSLMRNFDIPFDVPRDSDCGRRRGEVAEVHPVEGEENTGMEIPDGSIEISDKKDPRSLGDLSPVVVDYIQQLETELSVARKELSTQKQAYEEMENNRETNNNLLEYLRSLEADMVTELSRPSSSEVEEIIHQLVQNVLQKFFKEDDASDLRGDSGRQSRDYKPNGDDRTCDSIGTSRDYLAKLLFWCMLLGHHLRGLENRLHLSCAVGLL